MSKYITTSALLVGALLIVTQFDKVGGWLNSLFGASTRPDQLCSNDVVKKIVVGLIFNNTPLVSSLEGLARATDSKNKPLQAKSPFSIAPSNPEPQTSNPVQGIDILKANFMEFIGPQVPTKYDSNIQLVTCTARYKLDLAVVDDFVAKNHISKESLSFLTLSTVVENMASGTTKTAFYTAQPADGGQVYVTLQNLR